MSATLHPSLNKNTTLHRNSVGYSRVRQFCFPRLVGIESERRWASTLRCDLHNLALHLDDWRNRKTQNLFVGCKTR